MKIYYSKDNYQRQSINTQSDVYNLEKELFMKRRSIITFDYNTKPFNCKEYNYEYFAIYKSINYQNTIIYNKSFLNPPAEINTEKVKRVIKDILEEYRDFNYQPRGIMIIGTSEEVQQIRVNVLWDVKDENILTSYWDDTVEQLISWDNNDVNEIYMPYMP